MSRRWTRWLTAFLQPFLGNPPAHRHIDTDTAYKANVKSALFHSSVTIGWCSSPFPAPNYTAWCLSTTCPGLLSDGSWTSNLAITSSTCQCYTTKPVIHMLVPYNNCDCIFQNTITGEMAGKVISSQFWQLLGHYSVQAASNIRDILTYSFRSLTKYNFDVAEDCSGCKKVTVLAIVLVL